jgi:hypothetical protein
MIIIMSMNERMINMSKIGVIAVSVVILLLASALFYYANTLADSDTLLDSYSVRKEDIYTSQKKIEQSLYELNQTIQSELETQKILTDKISELSVKADLPPPVINTTKIVQQPPVTVTVPVSRPVTRAS